VLNEEGSTKIVTRFKMEHYTPLIIFFSCLLCHCFVQSAELEEFVFSELTNLRNEMLILKQNYQSLQGDNGYLKQNYQSLKENNEYLKQNYQTMKEDNEYLKRKSAELERDTAVIKETVVPVVPFQRSGEEAFRRNEGSEDAQKTVHNTNSSPKSAQRRTCLLPIGFFMYLMSKLTNLR